MPGAAGRPRDLPDFRNPPLVETVLSLQYEPVGLTAAHVGLLWQRFRDRLPLVEEHPPLPPVLEKFGRPSPAPVELIIQGRPPAPRIWFLNGDKTELVQIQPDRFIHNWRKLQGSQAYPRYEPIRDRFREEVGALLEFLEEERLGSLEVNQCEVTYVNHIEPSGVWERHGQLERVFRYWGAPDASGFLPEAEDGAVRLRFLIPDQAGKPLGRLYVMWQPAWRKADSAPVLILNLTARGAPLPEGIEGAFAFFDLGRRWIVRAFAELTTPEMHQVWGRTNG